MKITLNQLEIFCLIAKHNSVSLAADASHITQAAASMRLSELENKIGRKLFDRDGKQLILNSTGEQLLPRANAILEKSKAFVLSARAPNEIMGHLHIGASTTIANNILPKIISSFLQKYSGISIKLTTNNTKICIDKLINFEVDIVFVEGIYLHPKIEFKPWIKDHLNVICHPKHPLSQKKNITPKDLNVYPWILRETTSGTRQSLDIVLQQSQIVLEDSMIVNSSESIKNIVLEDKNRLACLSQTVFLNELKANRLITLKIKDWDMVRYFYQACYINKERGEIVRLFEQFLNLFY